jgi:hypothetical protein
MPTVAKEGSPTMTAEALAASLQSSGIRLRSARNGVVATPHSAITETDRAEIRPTR